MTSWLNQMVNMEENKKDNTEEKILVAAQSVFLRKGMDGSRMQEIANEAGINKALLHYYFRTKQKLFEAIFRKVFSTLFPNFKTFAFSDLPFEEKLGNFLDKYLDFLIRNQHLPIFILKEVNRDPEFMISTFKSLGINPVMILKMFENEMDAGRMRRMDPKDLIVNILSMCIFPVAAKPLLKVALFENDKNAYNSFLEKRKTSIKEFVINSIYIK